jgi:chitodextrinase
MNILSLIREAVSRAVSANIGGAAIKENSLVMRARQLSPQSLFPAHIAAMALVLIMVLGSPTAMAAPKRVKPTPTPTATPKPDPNAPGNFRVTALGTCTVTVAWDPVNFSSEDFNYYLSGAYQVTSAVLPKTATSHTFTGLAAGNEYWFFIYAKDVSGKVSGQSQVATRTLSDTTPPTTAPSVSVTEVGSNYVSIAWTPAEDDGCLLFYEVWVNGSLYVQTGKNVTAFTIRFLKPATTYSVTVRGYDSKYQKGPFSNPVSITTLPPNPNDHTPPNTPTSLTAFSYGDGSTEFQLMWTQSTDDFDRQENIRYDVYVNGVLEEVRFGSSFISSIYGQWGENTIEVIASDTAGNKSAPATTTISF